MINATARILLLHPDQRGNPHERAEFAWTLGAPTGKSTCVEMCAVNEAALIAKSEACRIKDRLHDVTGHLYNPNNRRKLHTKLETAQTRRD